MSFLLIVLRAYTVDHCQCKDLFVSELTKFYATESSMALNMAILQIFHKVV